MCDLNPKPLLQRGLNPSALVAYNAKKCFICVSVICGKASFPDQRIDFEKVERSDNRVSFSAHNENDSLHGCRFALLLVHDGPTERPQSPRGAAFRQECGGNVKGARQSEAQPRAGLALVHEEQ